MLQYRPSYNYHFHDVDLEVDGLMDLLDKNLGFWDHQKLEEMTRISDQKDIMEIIQFMGDRWGIDKDTIMVI